MHHTFDEPLQASPDKATWTPKGGAESVDVAYNGNTYSGCGLKTPRDAEPGQRYVLILDPNQGWVALTFALEDVSVAD